MAALPSRKVSGDGFSAADVNGVLDHVDGWTNVRTHGAVGDGTTDDAPAFAAAVAAAPDGGEIRVPPGIFRFESAVALRSGQRIVGAGNVDRFYGLTGGLPPVTFIYQATAGTHLFTIGEGVRDVEVSHMALSSVLSPTAIGTYPSVGKYGISAAGAYPNSSYRIRFDRLTFYNFERAISVVSTSGDWQFDNVTFQKCVFWNNRYGIYLSTANIDYSKIDTCWFGIPWSSDGSTTLDAAGIYLDRAGTLLIENSAAGPVPTVPADPQARTFDFIHIHGTTDDVTVINSQAESVTNVLHVDNSQAGQTYNSVKFIGCQLESPSKLERAHKIVSIGTRHTRDFDASSAAGTVIESISDSFHAHAFDYSTDFTPAAGGMSGSGSLVTVVYASHGLTAHDHIDALGSSTSGYNVTRARVIYVDANTFRYFGTGTGTPGTPPTISRYSRFKTNTAASGGPNDTSTVSILPVEHRSWPGSPINASDPQFVGEEVFDSVNSRWFRAVSLSSATGWKLTSGSITTSALVSSFGTNVGSDSAPNQAAQYMDQGEATLVRLFGNVVSTSGTVTAGSTLLTLDSSYRPDRTVIIPAASSTGTVGYITITSGGVLTASFNIVSGGAKLVLDGVSFRRAL